MSETKVSIENFSREFTEKYCLISLLNKDERLIKNVEECIEEIIEKIKIYLEENSMTVDDDFVDNDNYEKFHDFIFYELLGSDKLFLIMMCGLDEKITNKKIDVKDYITKAIWDDGGEYFQELEETFEDFITDYVIQNLQNIN